MYHVIQCSLHHPASSTCFQGYPHESSVIPFKYSLTFQSVFISSHHTQTTCPHSFSHKEFNVRSLEILPVHKEVNRIPTGLPVRLFTRSLIFPPTLQDIESEVTDHILPSDKTFVSLRTKLSFCFGGLITLFHLSSAFNAASSSDSANSPSWSCARFRQA